MQVDHIYIFCADRRAADVLVNFGLAEGSGNVHKGIGTANRRFFFENFYLEMLWVEIDEEAKTAGEIGIWERFNHQATGYSPYGLCYVNTPDMDDVFENAIQWDAQFLPEGMHIDILTNEAMPWIFRLPPGRRKSLDDEPTEHPIGMKRLTKAVFDLPQLHFENELMLIADHSITEFNKSAIHSLVLEFDNGIQGKTKIFEQFNLTISY